MFIPSATDLLLSTRQLSTNVNQRQPISSYQTHAGFLPLVLRTSPGSPTVFAVQMWQKSFDGQHAGASDLLKHLATSAGTEW